MEPVLRVDAGPLVDYYGVKQGILDEEELADDAVELVSGKSNKPGLDSRDVVAAFNGFLTGPERYDYNGDIDPASDGYDRENYLMHWKGYSLGEDYGPKLVNRSNLAERLSDGGSEDFAEDLERLGEWLADTFDERGSHRSVSRVVDNGSLQLDTVLGVLDQENDALRVLKEGEIDERDLVDSAVRLSGTDAERVEVIGLNGGVERREVDADAAENLVEKDLSKALKESSHFYQDVFSETASEIRSKTGLGFNELDDHEFVQLLVDSDLENGLSVDEKVSEAFEVAAEEYDSYEDIQEIAAEYLSEDTGLVVPYLMDSEDFLSSISGAEITDLDFKDILEKNAVRRAEDVFNTGNFSLEDLNNLRSSEDDGIYRDEDGNGKRVYRWGDKSAYSVTTIIDPLPTSHKEINTGGGLFHWKNIYDGSGGKYDSDIIRDYAGVRGTLAHEEVFSNYVDDESEVRDDTESSWSALEELEPGEEDLGSLQDILEWKDEDEMDVLEYDRKREGFVQNGRDLAEKEIDWIEEQFSDLEDDLGLSEDNVLYTEEEFVLETEHPWDKSDNLEGPGIGSFSYGGTVDMIYEEEDTGDIVLLDLKTGSMKPNYAVQQAAYKYAVENSEVFDDPRLEDGIDRVVVPEIDPESMMYTGKDPVIHTDQPYESEKYTTSEFLDASGIDLESSDYRENRWRPENWDEEALYIFARAAEQMPKDP